MNCERFEALLDGYVMGTLSEQDAQAMARHAKECESCARKLEDTRLLLQDLDSLDSAAQVPAAWMEGWREAIRREEKTNMQKQTEPVQKRRPWRAWLSAAAAVVVLTAGSLAARDWIPKTDGGQSAENGTVMMKAAGYAADMASGTADGLTWSAAHTPEAETPALRSSVTYTAKESAAGDEAAADQTANGVKIIRTASYTLATMAFEQDLDALKTLAASYGGWVEYASVSGDAIKGDLRYASLTLRIPTESLNTFQSGITSIGRVTASNESAEDVSENYSDTQMRLATQQEKMARLQKLMETAGELSDLLAVENEIADTQYQIDSYESSLQGLDSRINFSSVQVYLREETAGESATVKDLTLIERIQKGLHATFEAMGDFFKDLAVFLVMALPVALPLFLVIFLVVKVRKHHKLKKQQ